MKSDNIALLREINLQIHNYEFKFNIKPNNITLGVELYNLLRSDLTYGFDNITVYGIPLNINTKNTRTLQVGYLETIDYS